MSYETAFEVKLTPIYDYTPPERRTQDHPGYPAETEVTGAQINGIELDAYQFKRFWHDLDQEVKDQLIDEIIQHEAEKRDSPLFDFGVGLAKMYSNIISITTNGKGRP